MNTAIVSQPSFVGLYGRQTVAVSTRFLSLVPEAGTQVTGKTLACVVLCVESRMGYIREHRKGQWRAEVFKHGQRLSKVLPTRESAEDWVTLTEAKAGALSRRFAAQPATIVDGPDLVTAVPRLVLEAARSVPHSPLEVMAAAIPTRRASGIYFLLLGGEVVYVGQSVDVLHRVARHRREGRQFDAFSIIECEPQEMDELERKYILCLVPEGNLTFGNVKVRRRGGQGARA